MAFKNYFFIFLLFFYSFVLAQDYSVKELQNMKDKELLTLFSEVKTDSIKAEKVAQVYLIRAKKEKNILKIAQGFENLSKIFNSKKSMQYADSLILMTKNINNKKYPSMGYLIKAHKYNSRGNIKGATENYFKAYEMSIKNENIPYQVFALGRLLFLKSIWGDKREALALQKKRHAMIKSENYQSPIQNSHKKNQVSKDELTSIFNFSFCYLNLRKLDSAAIYANEGLTKANTYNGLDKDIVIDYFKEILVEINYYNKKYKHALTKIDSLLLKLNYKTNSETFQNLYFFKGLSLLKTDKYEKGIFYLKKSDSIFETESFKIKQPYQRELFEILLNHYKVNNDPKKQIEYLNKLITADSIIIKNYQYFEPNLIKKFETPKLIKEKERLITKLTKKNETKSSTLFWVIGLLSSSLLALGYYINRQRIYKKRFDNLISKQKKINTSDYDKPKKNELSKEIIHSILEQLEVFEKNKEYLSSDLSIQKMAKSFQTNYKYLSKVINLQKGKHFSSYINDLRIDYTYIELQKNLKLRNYTIKAIAKESGFNNAESFSKAFYKKFGIYPSYYIKLLKKTEK